MMINVICTDVVVLRCVAWLPEIVRCRNIKPFWIFGHEKRKEKKRIKIKIRNLFPQLEIVDCFKLTKFSE